MNHTMKLQERVLGYKLRHETKKKIGDSIWFYDDLPWNLFTQTSNEKNNIERLCAGF